MFTLFLCTDFSEKKLAFLHLFLYNRQFKITYVNIAIKCSFYHLYGMGSMKMLVWDHVGPSGTSQEMFLLYPQLEEDNKCIPGFRSMHRLPALFGAEYPQG